MRFGLQSILGAIVLWAATSVQADVAQLSNAELKTMVDKGIAVIDVRRLDEWQKTGVVEGSHLMTFFDERGRYDAQAWLSKLDKIVKKDQPFIVICAAGVRSKSITHLLDTRLGYTGVHNVTRGIDKWINDGQSVVPYSP